MKLEKLYKLSSTGKVQEWQVEFNKEATGASYTIYHGQLGGKIQSTTTYIDEGKNIGRSNETTAEEQAESEARSLWAKQRDRKGYSTDIPTEKPFRPMLAQSYDKHSGKIEWPAYVSPKLDGIRCIAFMNGDVISYMSRQGKLFNTLSHLDAELYPILKNGAVLDGELYNHSMKNNFQKLVSLIRRDKAVPDSSLIQYHVYDMISEDDYETRLNTFSSLLKNLSGVKVVDAIEIDGPDKVEEFHNKFVSDGYEGAILRNKVGPYEIDKRSYNLQKYKHFDTEEFLITGAEENVGKQAGQCSIICRTKDGKRFAVKPKGNEYEREEYWNLYLDGELEGQYLTVRFFGYTNDGVPRFPIGLVLRQYE